MIGRFLEGGDTFAHLRRYAVGVILRVVYGIEMKDGDGSLRFLQVEEETAELLSNEIMSGGGVWAVDMMPWRMSFLARSWQCTFLKWIL